MTSTKQTGDNTEQLARLYLEQKGMIHVESNFSSSRGEIDLIMHDSDTLVFVEVRYRRSDRYGSPAETITRNKQNRIIRCAKFYCQKKNLDSAARFDVVSLNRVQSKMKIEWIPDAFQVSCMF
ncbi:MAG: YraN family protein [Gammaproteobacteria bacterium]